MIKPFDFTFLVEKLVNIIGQHTKIHRVMVVDDDLTMTNLQAEILRHAGMDVLCVNQPLHSLQRAAKFKPDLVILDMHMPDINGMELGVNALLTKPFEVTELISVCEQSLADITALKNRVARITRHTQQPQQINRSYFFTAPNFISNAANNLSNI